MEIEIEGTPKALHKGHRPRVDGGPWDTTGDHLVHIILPNRGTDDRMDLRSEVLGRRHPVPQGNGH
jgi:hypothetical protein